MPLTNLKRLEDFCLYLTKAKCRDRVLGNEQKELVTPPTH